MQFSLRKVDLCGFSLTTKKTFLFQLPFLTEGVEDGGDPLGTWPWMVSAGCDEGEGSKESLVETRPFPTLPYFITLQGKTSFDTTPSIKTTSTR